MTSQGLACIGRICRHLVEIRRELSAIDLTPGGPLTVEHAAECEEWRAQVETVLNELQDCFDNASE